MSKADRASVALLARKRAKVARAMIGERVKALRADVEDQLSAEYRFDDDVWAAITTQAQRTVATADAQIAEICRQTGVPEHLRPSLNLSWHSRGENALSTRRAELRKLAQSRIDAAAESAKVTIEANLLDVETELVRDGLESAQAVAFLDAMPTPEQLVPAVDVTALQAGKEGDSRGGWSPPEGTSAALLTPSSATSREEKRRAVMQALTANPAGSDREIARAASVDHKTVGKLRGEFPAHSGELDGESPSDTLTGGA